MCTIQKCISKMFQLETTVYSTIYKSEQCQSVNCSHQTEVV
uniref:Uncharacterized protein n=1 Tax=Anguilla anguilla TaxID=7936 RepID=A0A0E9S144_ANGAN